MITVISGPGWSHYTPFPVYSFHPYGHHYHQAFFPYATPLFPFHGYRSLWSNFPYRYGFTPFFIVVSYPYNPDYQNSGNKTVEPNDRDIPAMEDDNITSTSTPDGLFGKDDSGSGFNITVGLESVNITVAPMVNGNVSNTDVSDFVF